VNSQILNSSTTYQIGWNIIDDNANSFGKILNKDSWYTDAFPGKISIMKSINSDWKVEGNLAVSKMKESYYSERYLNPGLFTCVDLNIRHQINPLNELFKGLWRRNSKVMSVLSQGGVTFEPIVGVGYTYRSQTVFSRAITFNFGFGTTYWLKRNRAGIMVQSIGKLGLERNIIRTGSNYINHSLGFVWVVRPSIHYRNFQYKSPNKDKFLY
jgi:hypothetical protein